MTEENEKLIIAIARGVVALIKKKKSGKKLKIKITNQ